MKSIKKPNNIEALRLFFAIQVMVVHFLEHSKSELNTLLGHLPGVPAFFFISGFLIYASYLNSRSLKSYAENRFLRIFPGLLLVTSGSLILIASAKGLNFTLENIEGISLWVILQLTIGQGYNPSIFSDIGVGAINGVLWTITVEILFYVSVPIICFLEKKSKIILPSLFFASFLIYSFGSKIFIEPIALGKTIYEFINLTPAVWGWMFILGIYAYKNLELISRYSKKLYLAAIPMTMIALLNMEGYLLGASGNKLGILYMACYCLLILYIAFEAKPIAVNFDISYGVYIWHMVVLNYFITFKIDGFILLTITTLAISTASWYLVEKPSLKLKKTSIMRTDSDSTAKASNVQHVAVMRETADE